MSVRFIILYLIVLATTTLFFLNITPTGNELSFYELNLAKLLNQSQTILLVGYLLIKYRRFQKSSIVLLLAAAYFIVFLSEFTFYLQNNDLMQGLNNSFIILCRIILIIVFYKEGAKIANFTIPKFIFTTLFLISVSAVIVSIYTQVSPTELIFMGITTIVLTLFVWFCINRPANIQNKIMALIASLFILYGDCVYLYSSYFYLLSFTFTWNRTFTSIADLVLVWSVLEGIPIQKQKLRNF